MFWNKIVWKLAAAVAATAFSSTAALAAIVVASSGPSARDYPVGRKLDDKGSITLRAGDTVTILDSKGTRVLRGAGTFRISQPGEASRASTLNAITRQRASSRVRTGAVRNDGTGPVASPSIWYVNIVTNGPQCVTSLDAIRFWRPDTKTAANYTVTDTRSGSRTALDFAAGDMLATWNLNKSAVSGDQFSIAAPDGKRLGEMSFVLIPDVPRDPEAVAAALIEKGCSAQLNLLALSTMI